MVGVSARAIRIGVLDNDPFALDAMCAMILAVSKDFRVMWSTGSPAVAIEHCHNPHTRPEVLVLDMALGVIMGADVCLRIRRRTGGTGIVCVTSYSVDVYQREAIASGAQGLVREGTTEDSISPWRYAGRLKAFPPDEQAAVGFRDAQTAYGLLSGTVPAKMSVDMRDPLSLREKEILRLYARRLTTGADRGPWRLSATIILLASTMDGLDLSRSRVMVAAVQSLAFYCFPLLTGLLLHVMRQRDHDSYLLRRQHQRGETARSLHDTIGNDLAYPDPAHPPRRNRRHARRRTSDTSNSSTNCATPPAGPWATRTRSSTRSKTTRNVHPTHRMKARTAASNPAQPIPRKSMPPRSVPGCNR